MKTLAQKQAEAAARQAAYEARTPEEQLRLINERPGQCERERAKIVKVIDNGEGKLPRKRAKKEDK